MLLIPLPCYLLENDSWCLTLLWAEPPRHQSWALGPGMGGSQPSVKWPSSPHAPLCLWPGKGMGWLLPQQLQLLQGGLLLLGTSSQTVCLLSQKQGMEQGGCTCWVPGECSAWGTGGSCSSPALCTGFLHSSDHSLGQGSAFFQLSILLSIHC